MSRLRWKAENLAITLAVLVVMVIATLAVRAVIDCHHRGGRAVKNMLDWPVRILPATEAPHADR